MGRPNPDVFDSRAKSSKLSWKDSTVGFRPIRLTKYWKNSKKQPLIPTGWMKAGDLAGAGELQLKISMDALFGVLMG